jgi:hypothetical protein
VIGPVAFTGVEVVRPPVGVGAVEVAPPPRDWLGWISVVDATDVGIDVAP